MGSQSLDAQGDFSIVKTEDGKLELEQKMWSTMGGFGAVSDIQVIYTHLHYYTLESTKANMSVLRPFGFGVCPGPLR